MSIAIRPVADGTPPRLEALRAAIDEELGRHFQALLRDGPEREHPLIGRIYRWLAHYLDVGGKRMHGISVLLAYRACSQADHRPALPVAGAFQLYHHHTLVHDDIYDEDDARRGWPSSHRAFADLAGARQRHTLRGIFRDESVRFGAIAAFAYGKICRALAGSLILEAPFPEGARVAVAAALDRHDLFDNLAQLKDVYHEGDAMPAPQACLDNAWLKTGRLFEVCAYAGARLADASAKRTSALRAWAGMSALAYQLQDDLEDLEIDSEKGQGRGVGTDLLRCKPTYLYALAMESARGEQRRTLERWLAGDSGGLGTSDLVAILRETGAIERCRARARTCVEEARTALLEATPAFSDADIEAMTELTEYFVSPAYWRRPIVTDAARAKHILG